MFWINFEKSCQERLQSCLAEEGGAKRRFTGSVMMKYCYASVVEVLLSRNLYRHRPINGRRLELLLYLKIDPDMDVASRCVLLHYLWRGRFFVPSSSLIYIRFYRQKMIDWNERLL